MRILVACEESQAVTIELRRLGHEAYSCDIIKCSGGHPEWHLQQDAVPLLNDGWDMIIAFPPCTKVSNAGAKHLYRGKRLNIQRYYEGMCGKALFEAIRHADCPRIAVENPVPSRVFEYPAPTQIVQPYMFGDPWSKKTLLWLKGLPPLEPTNPVSPWRTATEPEHGLCAAEKTGRKTGAKRRPDLPAQWRNNGQAHVIRTEERTHERYVFNL